MRPTLHIAVIDEGRITYRTRDPRNALRARSVAPGSFLALLPAGLWSELPPVGSTWTAPRDPRVDPRVGDVIEAGGVIVRVERAGLALFEQGTPPRRVPWTEHPGADLARWVEAVAGATVHHAEANGPTPWQIGPPRARVRPPGERAVLAALAGGARHRREIAAELGGQLSERQTSRAIARLIADGFVERFGPALFRRCA